MKVSRKQMVLLIVLLCVTGAVCVLNSSYKIYALNIRKENSPYESQVSLMTFNVASDDTTSFTPDRQDQLLKLIATEQPDILCLQEMSFENLRKIKPQLDSIYGSCENLKGDDQLWRLRFYSHYPIRNFKRYKCTGDIKTDDLNADEKSDVEIIQKQMNVMSAEFEIEPGKWVTIFSGHLRSSAYSTARRSMSEDTNWLDGIALYKRNYYVGKRFRDYEARNVRKFIDIVKAEGMPVIVAGDLNDWCGSDCLDILMSNDLKDAWWEGGNGLGWTYFGWHLRLRLDHILYSDELELAEVKVVDTDISDHKPLLAGFKINNLDIFLPFTLF